MTGEATVTVRRIFAAINLAIFLISVLVILVALNFFSLQPSFRAQIDATKTRAYSLSPQTRNLLSDLEGDWTIALLVSERYIDPPLRRQVDEVLRRFSEAAPSITVQRIDPTDPGSLEAYDAILAELQMIYADLVQTYDVALDEGERAFTDLQDFARQHAGPLQSLLSVIPREKAQAEQLQARALNMNVLATQAEKAIAVIHDFRSSDDVQPIPDYDAARSTLVTALTQWGNQCQDIAFIFEKWLELPDLDVNVLSYLAETRGEYEVMAQKLVTAADPLARLAPLELSRIGRQIQSGECALIMGPDRAASIRSSQLFPQTISRPTATAAVTFDQRFRGEQLIASTIRSLIIDHMPLVVFVHGDDRSLFRPGDRQADLVGVKDILTLARFEVKEWAVGRKMTRPKAKKGQPVVWIVVRPVRPLSQESIEPSEGELRLIDATSLLIDEGESVMLSIYPSPLPHFGQSDPWRKVVSILELEIDTSRAVFEKIRGPAGIDVKEHGQVIQTFTDDHPVAVAVNGLPAYFNLPLSIDIPETSLSGSTFSVIAHIEPGPNRWLEPDWYRGANNVDDPKEDEYFDDPLPLVIAIDRPHPIERSRQRCMLFGSGGWMLTYIADRVYSIGGNRVALEFPGNYELMLASIAWLAGMDELIAPSPMTQEIARLQNITPADRRRWLWLTLVGLPSACVALGLMMWWGRRF